jgi:3-hydroxyisobutyrate dehydrogenase-like beta-hydroxyacid dehydrogenase
MRVAVLGLGRMGIPISARLEGAGHELTVWNRSPGPTQAYTDRGIRVLGRPSEAWEHADVCITMLADGPALEAVALGEDGLLAVEANEVLASETSGALVDMSTVGADTSARVADECGRRGVSFLRAPVSGNPSVVAAGNLGIIVSGPRDAFDRLGDTLRDIGPNLFYVGAGEESRIVKLALNVMIGGTAQLIAEALVLAEKYGIDRATMLEVIGGTAVGSPFVKYKTDALVADDYSSTFTSSLMYKDLALALEAAQAVGAPLPVAAVTQQLVEACIATGLGDADFTALLPRLRREAGL